VLQFRRSEAGYATLTAIVLCAAVSILCAGALTLADSQKRAELGKFHRLQRDEAINSAVMQFASKVASAESRYEVRGSEFIRANGKTYDVKLVAQAEHAKWPLSRISEINSVHLSRATRLNLEQVREKAETGAHNDCVDSLFSRVGLIDPSKELPKGRGPRAVSAAKDGQIWRIRAVAGTRVEERRVRFLGDPDHVFALVSVYRTTLGDMPECTDLIRAQ
jgi:hypothetical protein